MTSKITENKTDIDTSNQNDAPESDREDHTPSSDFHFFTIDANERLLRPAPPQKSEFLSQAEQMVSWAISSKHENAPALHINSNSTSTEKKDEDGTNPNNTNPAIEAAQCHSLLINSLTKKSDPVLLHATLHALLSSNHGRELDRLVSHSKLHAQTIHLIMRLDPFVPGVDMSNALRDLENVRRERGKIDIKPTMAKKGVQIAESSIVYKEDQKYIVPSLPFFNYEIADVHLYLIVALVSNNSLLGVSAVRAIWKMLTDFGFKWMKEANDERKKSRVASQQKQTSTALDEANSPPTKRRKIDESSQENNSVEDASIVKEALVNPEGLKQVPGMIGLSVDFVRATFYNDKESDESICSGELPRGRVKRLLLALINIFRLNHRSKNDIINEISTNFPHYKTSPVALHRWYINICLQLVHLVPTLEGPIVNLLVDHALEMDVQIKINDHGGVFLDEDASEDMGQNTVSKKRSYQIISRQSLSATKNSNSTIMNSPMEESDEITDIAERLDNLMNILCQRIQKQTTFSSESASEALTAVVNARRLYRHLDDIFDKKVRTTHRSKFVPFIFFVLFGREADALEAVGKLMVDRKNDSPSTVAGNVDTLQDDKNSEVKDIISASINQTDFLYRGFCAKLIDLFYNPVDPGELPSQTVVCCLASFVSRATYVCPETVCETVAAILQWIEAYIEAHTESQGTLSSIRRQSSGLGSTQNQRDIHALFYTACQSAFYIMCFRGAEALHYYQTAWRHRDDPESQFASPESVNLEAKRWKAIVKHPLQPLRNCLESVRVEFLHVAEDLDLFVERTDDGSSESKDEEAKQFLQLLWSTNNQGKSSGEKSKMVTPKRRRSSVIKTAATQEKKRLDGGVGGLGKGSNPLDSYFPFDPYLLKSSHKYVEPYYRNWDDCILTMDDLYNTKDADSGIDHSLEEEVDDNSVLTSSDDENEVDGREESDDDNSEDNQGLTENKEVKPTQDGNGLEVEIRRCRAMSTGSQASW